MTSQPELHAGSPARSRHLTLGGAFLGIVLVLSLAYYAALLLDLALHPSEPGIGVAAFSLALQTAERYIDAVIATGTIVVGAFIIRRVPGNRIGPLLIVWGAAYAGFEMRIDYGSPLLTSLAHLSYMFVLFAGLIALTILLLIFPTGQFYPRWVKYWVTPYIVLDVCVAILYLMALNPSASASSLGGVSLPLNPLFVPELAPYYTLLNDLQSASTLLAILAALMVFIVRYRAARTLERQQLKWFIWVTAMVLLLAIPDVTVSNASLLSSPFVIAYLIFFYALIGAFPAVAIGLAILRSQLWDIDVIINRTLVYGTLTILLAVLYFGLVIGLQSLVGLLTHGIIGGFSQSPLIIVASTLLIAALFQPLRHRLQALIDHRFYRRKYDVATTLAAFGATLQSELDVNQLSEHLLRVVEETMQPTSVSLWLRQPDWPSQNESEHTERRGRPSDQMHGS